MVLLLKKFPDKFSFIARDIIKRTRCTAVDQRSQRLAVPPVLAEVVDWHIGNFVLNPAQQTLLRCL